MLLIFVVFCQIKQMSADVGCVPCFVSISIKAIKVKENMILNTDSLASRINMV